MPGLYGICLLSDINTNLLAFNLTFYQLNPFPTSGDFCRLLINFTNRLEPDQAQRFIGPDLVLICLIL